MSTRLRVDHWVMPLARVSGIATLLAFAIGAINGGDRLGPTWLAAFVRGCVAVFGATFAVVLVLAISRRLAGSRRGSVGGDRRPLP